MDTLKQLLNDFDPLKLLPDLETALGRVELIVRIAVLLGPLILLGLGLWFFLAPPKEANHRAGYQCYWGKSSVEAWQFTQRLAGAVFSVLGLGLTVAMSIAGSHLRGLELEPMVMYGIRCVLWQIGLIAAACLGIDITVVACFDRKGYRRRKRNH